MQIALSHVGHPFASLFVEALAKQLPEDSVVSWERGEPAPTAMGEILLAMGPVTERQMEACPQVALVQAISAGFEGVDIAAATRLGMWVSYAPSDRTGNADAVAEFAILLLLATSRSLLSAVQSIRDPAMQHPVLTSGLTGKRICIVGLGSTGKALLDRLRPFGMAITAVNRHPERAPADVPTLPLSRLNEAVAAADYVVICVRATADNEHLFNASVFAAMKQGATLLNIARGSLVDETALHEALASGHIQAAGLDVLQTEPARGSDPLVGLPEALVTPHVAGFTDTMLHGTIAYTLEVIECFKRRQRFASLLNEPPFPRVPLR